MHEKVAAIDGRILWHGSLNILSHNNGRESMLRFESRDLVHEILQDLGISSALEDDPEDGDRGLALTLSGEPDLVLLDIRLPGMDGLTVLEKMRAGYSESAVVVMTADNTATNAIRATQLGAFDYIAKPIDPGVLG